MRMRILMTRNTTIIADVADWWLIRYYDHHHRQACSSWILYLSRSTKWNQMLRRLVVYIIIVTTVDDDDSFGHGEVSVMRMIVFCFVILVLLWTARYTVKFFLPPICLFLVFNLFLSLFPGHEVMLKVGQFSFTQIDPLSFATFNTSLLLPPSLSSWLATFKSNCSLVDAKLANLKLKMRREAHNSERGSWQIIRGSLAVNTGFWVWGSTKLFYWDFLEQQTMGLFESPRGHWVFVGPQYGLHIRDLKVFVSRAA